MRRAAAMAIMAVAFGACSLLPGQGEVTVEFENTSTLDIRIVVNGRPLDVIEAGGSGGASITGVPFPIHVEAFTPAGRTLGSLQIEAAPTCTTEGEVTSCTGEVLLVDMVCGRFAMWAAAIAPSLPAPVPGEGRPCGP